MMDKGGTSVESNNSRAERRKRDPIGQILDFLSNASPNSTEEYSSRLESKNGTEIYSSNVQKDTKGHTKIENVHVKYAEQVTEQEPKVSEEGSAFKPFYKNFSELPNTISNAETRFMQNNFTGLNNFGTHQLYADQSETTRQVTNNASLFCYPGFPIQYPNIPNPTAQAMMPTLPFIFPQNYGFCSNFDDTRNVNMLSWFGKKVTTDASFNPACILNSEKTGSHVTHSPPRYQCESCKKSYSTYGGLSKHKQFHCVNQVKKEFSCKFCGKCYGSLGALKMHIRTHTLPCKCKICGKAFSRPWLLQGHIRTHTGEKPFRCDHCTRAFADRSNLRAHLQTHSEVKKYGCKSCNKTFSRMSLLVKHRENHCYR